MYHRYPFQRLWNNGFSKSAYRQISGISETFRSVINENFHSRLQGLQICSLNILEYIRPLDKTNNLRRHILCRHILQQHYWDVSSASSTNPKCQLWIAPPSAQSQTLHPKILLVPNPKYQWWLTLTSAHLQSLHPKSIIGTTPTNNNLR